MQTVLVFFAWVVLDYFWARYMATVAADKVWSAMGNSMAITALATFSAIQNVDNHWMIIPSCLGCAVGTALAMRGKWAWDRLTAFLDNLIIRF